MSNSYQTDSTHEILKMRISHQEIKSGLDAKKNQPIAVFRVGAFQPRERPVCIVQSRVKKCHPVRPHISRFFRFGFLELEALSPIAAHPVGAIGPIEIGNDRGRKSSHTSPLLIRSEGLGIPTGSEIRVA